MLQSLLYESSRNNAVLNNVAQQSKVGFSSGLTLDTEVLDLALAVQFIIIGLATV